MVIWNIYDKGVVYMHQGTRLYITWENIHLRNIYVEYVVYDYCGMALNNRQYGFVIT